MDALRSVIDTAQAYKSLLSAALTGISVYALVTYFRSPFRKLPPGPKGLPFLGNIFQITGNQWTVFTNLQKKYGDLIYLNVAGSHMVIVSSPKIAADLLDRRSITYSGRPQNIVASDIMTGGLIFALIMDNNTWRRHRKAANECLNKGSVHQFYPTQYIEGLLLACGLLAEPDDWDRHLRRTAASSTISIIYDKPPIISGNDEAVSSINDFGARMTRALAPGAHLVEFLPWMMYLPKILAPWRRKAEASFITDSAMFERLLRGVRQRMSEGEDRPSVAATLLQTADKHGLSERENAWLAGALFTGGADTTTAAMAWWILAMVIYPETQKCAQAELDAVVGRGRLPKFTDFDNLPYIHAMTKELLRWCPLAPLGIPHRSTVDDWYEGYFIPAGTVIVPNAWLLNRHPEAYGEDAEQFNPARHLDVKGQIAPGPADSKEEGHFTYGFGRRICIGRHVANNSLFIDIAIVLWAMNIERATDAHGVPLPIDADGFEDVGIVVRPVSFQVKLTPRFPGAATLLELERESYGLPAFPSKE